MKKFFSNIFKQRHKKDLLLINAVILLLIGLLTLLGQISDSKVSDYQNDIILSQNQANNIMIRKITSVLTGNMQQLYLLHGYRLDPSSLSTSSEEFADPRFVALREKYQSDEINENAFLKGSVDIYFDIARDLTEKYNTKASEINNKIQGGTIWTLVGRTSYLLQILLIVASGMLNVFLIRKSSIASQT